MGAYCMLCGQEDCVVEHPFEPVASPVLLVELTDPACATLEAALQCEKVRAALEWLLNGQAH